MYGNQSWSPQPVLVLSWKARLLPVFPRHTVACVGCLGVTAPLVCCPGIRAVAVLVGIALREQVRLRGAPLFVPLAYHAFFVPGECNGCLSCIGAGATNEFKCLVPVLEPVWGGIQRWERRVYA